MTNGRCFWIGVRWTRCSRFEGATHRRSPQMATFPRGRRRRHNLRVADARRLRAGYAYSQRRACMYCALICVLERIRSIDGNTKQLRRQSARSPARAQRRPANVRRARAEAVRASSPRRRCFKVQAFDDTIQQLRRPGSASSRCARIDRDGRTACVRASRCRLRSQHRTAECAALKLQTAGTRARVRIRRRGRRPIHARTTRRILRERRRYPILLSRSARLARPTAPGCALASPGSCMHGPRRWRPSAESTWVAF